MILFPLFYLDFIIILNIVEFGEKYALSAQCTLSGLQLVTIAKCYSTEDGKLLQEQHSILQSQHGKLQKHHMLCFF